MSFFVPLFFDQINGFKNETKSELEFQRCNSCTARSCAKCLSLSKYSLFLRLQTRCTFYETVFSWWVCFYCDLCWQSSVAKCFCSHCLSQTCWSPKVTFSARPSDSNSIRHDEYFSFSLSEARAHFEVLYQNVVSDLAYCSVNEKADYMGCAAKENKKHGTALIFRMWGTLRIFERLLLQAKSSQTNTASASAFLWTVAWNLRGERVPRLASRIQHALLAVCRRHSQANVSAAACWCVSTTSCDCVFVAIDLALFVPTCMG